MYPLLRLFLRYLPVGGPEPHRGSGQDLDAGGSRMWRRLVLVVGGALSVAAFLSVDSMVEREAQQRFNVWVGEVATLVEKRFESYNSVLYGLRGLFNARGEVSRSEFRQYVDSLSRNERFPGLLSLNFARLVSSDQKPAFEAAVRGDRSQHPRGYPAFKIFPPGEREHYLVLEYVEPSDEPAALRSMGWDILMVSDHTQERRRVMDESRDHDLLRASGKLLRLVHDPSIAMVTARLPVFKRGMSLGTVDERREAFFGNIGYGIVLNDMMRPLFPPSLLAHARVRLHDGGAASDAGLASPAAANLLFDSDDLLAGASDHAALTPVSRAEFRFTQSVPLIISGRKWVLHFGERAGRELSEQLVVWGTLVSGLSITLLLHGLLRSLLGARERALRAMAGIIHDINQPVAAVAALSANAESYLRNGREREVQANLQMVGELAGRMTRMVGQLRHLARDDEEMVLEAVSVREALDNALLLVEQRVRDASTQVRVMGDGVSAKVIADAVRLEQVLLNLIRNALDAMEGMERQCIVVRIDADDDRVLISVRDQGPGIPAQALPHVFESFYTTKGPRGGLGLGLSTSLATVRRFGGDMAARNTAEGGAQFDITLRAAS